ncbi:hypothetical protein [Kitasatospora sp. NPDC088351]|uniref:hypothetical protein n=1 Tax=Kitasatospora sp. NPDC088351 TaxID=3155180 RepID=UPI003430C9D4
MAGTVLSVALVVTGAAACDSDGNENKAAAKAAPTTAAVPEVFGAGGYRGLALGMAKDVALATGALETAPVSLLNGCTDFAFKGGPAPDQARLAAEAAVQARFAEADANERAAKRAVGTVEPLPPNASVEQLKERADRMVAQVERMKAAQTTLDQLSKAADELKAAKATRDKAFLTAGRVQFGLDGLRELAAPAEARTAEGLGAGSTLDDLKRVYGDKGLELGKTGRYEMPAEGAQAAKGWKYEFTVEGEKVGGMSLVNRSAYCS